VDLGLTVPETETTILEHARTLDGSQTIINHFYSIHNVIGGAGDDQIWGSFEDNLLLGGAGDDKIYGRLGTDTLEGGPGDDKLWGGDEIIIIGDNDTASYASAEQGVEVNLGIIGGQNTLSAGFDTLVGISNLIGSEHDDRLTGDIFDNFLFGGKGADILSGGLGADTLEGGAGDDQLDGGGNIYLFWDIASYATAEQGVEVYLGDTGEQDTVGAGKDTLVNIEGLAGSPYDDILRGDDSDNALTGNAGDDILEGGLGLNSLDGGEGSDTASYAHAENGVSVDLRIPLLNVTGGAGTDLFTSIENLTGSDHDDTLTGDFGPNTLTGGKGTDVLNGKEGADTYRITPDWSSTDQIVDDKTIDIDLLDADVDFMPGDEVLGVRDTLDLSNITEDLTFTIHADGTVSVTDGVNTLSHISNLEILTGGSGNNTFNFEDGAEFNGTIDGGDGLANTLDYSAYTDGITVDLRPQDNEELGKATGTEGVRNIHNVVGGSGNDEITGDSNDNEMRGGLGEDTLSGMDGDDLLHGNEGDDALQGGAGDDTLEGDAGKDILEGGAGDDTLIGGTGDDTLKGDAGSDTASYAGSNSGVTVNLNQSAAQPISGGEIDTLENIENLTGSSGDDVLIGNDEDNILEGGAGNDKLYGRKGDDTLLGGLGNDTLSGGDGNDTASYGDIQGGGVKVTLEKDNEEQNTLNAGNDILISIANLIGSDHNDILTGNADSNFLFGGTGDDSLEGGAGDDALLGGEGIDTLIGGLGDDYLEGGAGNDTLTGEEGDDILEGGADGDAIDGGMGSDTVSYLTATDGVTVSLSESDPQDTGGGGVDTLYRVENLTGSTFDDTLSGDNSDNIIFGITGDDTLEGGEGDDVLDGGEGRDTATYRNDLAGIDANLTESTVTDGFGDTEQFPG
jgi:Ca2+-binding RTX toxin-like protein